MNIKSVYIFLCLIGTVLPMSQFLPWVAQNGLSPSGFVVELFSTKVGSFFGLDVAVSAAALFVFIYVEGKRLHIKKLWLPVIATLSIGVSLGLPLFLLMRHNHAGSRVLQDG